MNKIKEKALEYLSHNISVIPCGVDKKPLVSWKKYQTRIATKEEVKSWFSKFPDMQIGIVTGKISGLIVVDIDDPMADLKWLPKTAIVQTGSGGFHYYYKYSVNFKNKARIKESIDIRAEGGYVLAPPSKNLKGEYKLVNQMDLQPFPAHLFYKVDKPVQQYIKTEFNGFSQGNRNHEMVRYIGHLLAKIHPSEWKNIGWKMANEANAKNEPPLEERELQTIFDSIANAEKNNTTQRWYKNQEQKTNEPILLDDNDEVITMAEASLKGGGTSEAYPCGIKIFDNVMKGGFRGGDFVVISAPTGIGKTTLCQNFTVNLAKEGILSLWFSYEVSIRNLWEKFKSMGLTENEVCYTPARIVSGQIEWIEKKIKEAKEKYGVKAIFIDHLGFLIPRLKNGTNINKIEGNYAMYLTQISREIKMLAVKEDIMIFVPAHMKKTEKPGMNDISYSAGIAQEADYVFLMNRETNPDEENMNFYTNFTEITVGKNRLEGINIRGWFEYINNKFIFNPNYKPYKPKKSKF